MLLNIHKINKHVYAFSNIEISCKYVALSFSRNQVVIFSSRDLIASIILKF
jgi:hypothetical protein